MSVSYRTVQWNRQKRLYDLVLFGGIVVFLGVFAVAQSILHPEVTAETLMIRATAVLAITLLHVILAIGPLARLDSAFLPLLYNRRHLGVTMFLVAFVHGLLSLLQFHALGDTSPFVSLFVSNTRYDSIAQFPFQVLGFGALLVFFLMAVTSHDFWLANLGPRFWKTLHMGVYGAYGLVIAHVMLGSAQRNDSLGLVAMLGAGGATLVGLHLVAGTREVRRDGAGASGAGVAGAGTGSMGRGEDRFVRIGPADGIPEDRARVVCLGGERIAVFRYDGKVSAISNVCRHQNGPLGEGKVIDGCVTCPWHGFQYLPSEGRAPAPFTEKIETYDVEVRDGDVFVDPTPKPPGTPTEPARIGEGGS